MKHKTKQEWHSTKYENHRGRWRAARKGHVSSRLVIDLQAEAYQSAIESYANGALIDLGCGNAPLAGLYGPRVASYVWADWPNSLHQIFELDYEVDLTRPLPFAAESFDTILLSDVLEHISEPDALFGELRRVLRPDGHLIVGVPFLYQIHEEPYDFHRYTRFKLADFGTKHALNVIEVREVGGALDVLADILCKLTGAFCKPLARLPYHIWRSLSALPPVRRINRKSMGKLPLAYLAIYRRDRH